MEISRREKKISFTDVAARDYMRNLIDSSTDAIISTDKKGRIVIFNHGAEKMLGYRAEEVVGRCVVMLYESEEKAKEVMRQMYKGGGAVSNFETAIKAKSGELVPVLISASQLRDKKGEIIGTVGYTKDMRDRMALEAELKEKVRMMMELSTPVTQVWDGILTLPLIGTIDTSRAKQIMEELLKKIVETQASIVILDITGVPIVDTMVANNLIKTVQAAALIGARCLLVGISPQIAQTLVHLGINLSSIETCATLRSGLQKAFDILNLKVTEKSYDARH